MVNKENQNQQDSMTEDKTRNEDVEQDIKDSSSNGSEQRTNPFDESDIAEERASQKEEEQEQEEETNQAESGDAALAEAKDKYLRLFAEFENFRRRTAKERLDLIKTASEDLVAALLPVVDDFERSLEIFNENEAVAPMYEGIQLVYQKMLKILEQKGLTRMDVARGSEFDSEYHEAVVQTPAPSEELKGKVVDVIESGYFLGEKVLRYAKVVIGS